MAGRPEKHTVDYFSHDAKASAGKTLTILFNHFGHEGISAWWLLLEQLAGTNKHFIYIKTAEEIEFLAGKLHFLPQKLTEILKKMAALEAIDSELYQNGIIWSQNFVERLKPVYEKRRQEIPQKPIVVVNNSISVTEMPISCPEMQQSKVNKSKVNNTKESIERKNYGEFLNVSLSDEEYKKLSERFGEEKTKALIEILSTGIKSKGYKYKDHYATVLNWERRDNGKNGGNHGQSKPNPKALPAVYTRPEEYGR